MLEACMSRSYESRPTFSALSEELRSMERMTFLHFLARLSEETALSWPKLTNEVDSHNLGSHFWDLAQVTPTCVIFAALLPLPFLKRQCQVQKEPVQISLMTAAWQIGGTIAVFNLPDVKPFQCTLQGLHIFSLVIYSNGGSAPFWFVNVSCRGILLFFDWFPLEATRHGYCLIFLHLCDECCLQINLSLCFLSLTVAWPIVPWPLFIQVELHPKISWRLSL